MPLCLNPSNAIDASANSSLIKGSLCTKNRRKYYQQCRLMSAFPVPDTIVHRAVRCGVLYFIVTDVFKMVSHIVTKDFCHNKQSWQPRRVVVFTNTNGFPVGSWSSHRLLENNPYKVAFMSIKDQLKHKFILCPAGSDAATNLRVMSKLCHETWLMERRLEVCIILK